jgi:hypothetical protein
MPVIELLGQDFSVPYSLASHKAAREDRRRTTVISLGDLSQGVGMVRRLAAMAGKPPRSSSMPYLGKGLTCVLQMRTFDSSGRRQHSA